MLEKVTVDPSFWELFPNAQVNIMLVSGIDNHDTDDNLARRRKLLREGSDKGEDLHPISPLVDVYNSGFLAHGVPIGIEDQDKLAGTMHLG